MPASNRRPLYDDADAPQPSDIKLHQPPPETVAVSQQLSPALTPAAAAFAGPQASFKQPCTLKGASSALYAGALGYFLGVVPATIKFKARQWGMIHTQGLASAQQLAIMSGMYTAVHCICQRIRRVEDGWNRGIAGCSTGLVLGWNNGPWSALQSCAGLGLISALIDLGGGVEAAEARMLQPLQHTQHMQMQPQQRAEAAHMQEGMEQQRWGVGGQALAGLPQLAQLLALLMGASPTSTGGTATPSNSSSSSSNGVQPALSVVEQVSDTQQACKQQRLRKRNSKSEVHQAAAELHGLNNEPLSQQQQLPLLQHQQPLAAAALMMQPAARAVQQLMSAPPLMFLGACCHSNAVATSTTAAADADVDGCPLAVTSTAAAAGRSRRY